MKRLGKGNRRLEGFSYQGASGDTDLNDIPVRVVVAAPQGYTAGDIILQLIKVGCSPRDLKDVSTSSRNMVSIASSSIAKLLRSEYLGKQGSAYIFTKSLLMEGKRKLQEGLDPITGLEITMEDDLAIVKVDGEEVEAVKIEEGDNIVEVVEEIKVDYLEGKLGKRSKTRRSRKLMEGSGDTKREMMGDWVVYLDTDESGEIIGISNVQHSKRLDTVFIEASKPFGKEMAVVNVGWISAGMEGSKPELVQARIDLMQDAVDTVNALIKKYPELIRWAGK